MLQANLIHNMLNVRFVQYASRYNSGSFADGRHLRQHVRAMAGRLRFSGILYVQRQLPAVARLPVTLFQRVRHVPGGDDRRGRLLSAAGLRRLRGTQRERRRLYRAVSTDAVADEFLNKKSSANTI